MTTPPKPETNHAQMAQARAPELLDAARQAQRHAYAPYSGFPVGAAVLLSDGAIYAGGNVENASFGLTVCAERAAIFSALSAGRRDIAAVAVVTGSASLAKPCGACRQVIAEFSLKDDPIMVLCACEGGQTSLEPITALLPDTFTLR